MKKIIVIFVVLYFTLLVKSIIAQEVVLPYMPKQYIPLIQLEDFMATPDGNLGFIHKKYEDVWFHNADGYISKLNTGYTLDYSESDQGKVGLGKTAKSFGDDIGATQNATIIFAHHPSEGDTTTYTFLTAYTFSSNVSVIIEDGAKIEADDCTVTFNGPVISHCSFQWITETGTGSIAFGEDAIYHCLKHLTMSIDPGSWYDVDTEIFLMTVDSDAPNGIQIYKWKSSCNVDPDTEINADLRYADAWIGLASAADIDEIDTTSGTSSESTVSNINSGNAVANGKIVYIGFDGDPEGTCTQWIFEMWFYAL